MVQKWKSISTSNQTIEVDASALRLLARRLADLRDEIKAGSERAHTKAVQIVYANAKTIAGQTSRQALQVASDASVFNYQVRTASSALLLNGGTNQATGKHDPRNFAFGSEFGAHEDVPRRLQPRPDRRFGKIKNPRSKSARELVQVAPARDVMLGWNQFQPWRGNRAVTGEGVGRNVFNDTSELPGYWMFPSVRKSNEAVVQAFGTEAMKTVQDILNN